MDTVHRLNDLVLSGINDFARNTPWLHGIALGYATYGLILFAALLVVGVWIRRAATDRALAAAGWAPLAVLIAVGINQPLVALFDEARPYAAHPGLLVLADRTTDPSFPSDHAVMAGAAAGGLWLVSRVLGAIATAAAVAMAFTRVYICAHYPGDVTVGLLVGALIALGGWFLLRGPLTTLAGWLRARAGLGRVFAPTWTTDIKHPGEARPFDLRFPPPAAR